MDNLEPRLSTLRAIDFHNQTKVNDVCAFLLHNEFFFVWYNVACHGFKR